MTQPLGGCPGCGGDEPFEQVHSGGLADCWRPAGRSAADSECPDLATGAAACAEWVCSGCGAGVFMGTMITGISAAAVGRRTVAPARQSARAA